MRSVTKTMFYILFSALTLAVVGRVDAAPEKVNVLIVTGFDVGSHKWEASTKLIESVLAKSGRFDVKVSTDKEVFASPKLSDHDVVVLSYGFWKEADPSEKAKKGLTEYVKNGGNIVALHFACRWAAPLSRAR